MTMTTDAAPKGMTPPTFDPVEFGRRVRERRQELRLSQEELARRAGLCRDTVAVIERGQGTTTDTLWKLILSLHTDANALLPVPDTECMESPTASLA